MQHFRFRNILLIGGSLLAAALLLYSDPNGGAVTAILASQLATPIIAVWFAHLARKALFDYVKLQELIVKAKESAVGAAIVFASICLIMFGLLGLFGNQVRAAEVKIPEKAYVYIPMVKAEQTALWVEHPKPTYSVA